MKQPLPQQQCRRTCTSASTKVQRLHCWNLALSIILLSTWVPSHAFTIPDPMVHFSIGALAGGVGAVAAYPCDYIKSQLQTGQGKDRYQNNGWKAFCETLTDHPMQLYKGVGVQVLGVAPEKGIKLAVNDVLATASRHFLDGSFPLWAQVLSGATSGCCQVVASSPLEVLKVGLQTSNMTITEVWHHVGGIAGLFRGAEACIARDVIFTSICFPLYAHWVDAGVPTFIAGAMSGAIGSFAATPPDVIKTRTINQYDCSNPNQQQQKQIHPRSKAFMPPFATATTANYQMAMPSTSSLFSVRTNSTNNFMLEPFSMQDFVSVWNNNDKFLSSSSPQRLNSFQVLQNVLEKEGPTVLFSGVWERCIGAIPRFGTTLAMHDWLEHLAAHSHWLAPIST
jgi:hypothetical protein